LGGCIYVNNAAIWLKRTMTKDFTIYLFQNVPGVMGYGYLQDETDMRIKDKIKKSFEEIKQTKGDKGCN
jgi:hypothetical protein